MISFVRGQLFSIDGDNMVIDVGGIGYQVIVPPLVFKLPPTVGEELLLYTHLQVREDAWQLFGFPEKEQLEVFRHLISVTGIGPKLGVTILNHLAPSQIVRAIITADRTALSSIPGIGKKTGERLILELKDKFTDTPLVLSNDEGQSQKQLNQDAYLALTQLGYSVTEVKNALKQVASGLSPEASTQEIIKSALKLLGKY